MPVEIEPLQSGVTALASSVVEAGSPFRKVGDEVTIHRCFSVIYMTATVNKTRRTET
jgi:hypothetical protein